jgi:hypothetical protein
MVVFRFVVSTRADRWDRRRILIPALALLALGFGVLVPPPVPTIFTLVTAPRRERVSPLMRPAYRTLARLEPRNDGNLVWYDQIPPGSRLLGYLDADHWGMATPFSEQIPIASPFFADSVPRPSIIEAALEVVSTSLRNGRDR